MCVYTHTYTPNLPMSSVPVLPENLGLDPVSPTRAYFLFYFPGSDLPLWRWMMQSNTLCSAITTNIS